MHVPRRWLMVNGVGVAERHRRGGVGRALIEHAHAWAQARGLGEVELTVWNANRNAIAFYQRLGYTTAVRRLSRTL